MRRAIPWAVAALGTALALAGVAVFWWTNARPPTVTYGGSYAPLTEAYDSTLTLTSDGATVLWTRGHLVGAVLLVAGALLLAAAGGWALGRRSARRAAA